jgi:hypothetical protein
LLKAILGSLVMLGASQAAVGATFFTSKCSQFGHPEFQISVSDQAIPRADVDWFLATLESMVAAGERFKAGETMQIGWMITKIEQGDRGAVKLTEPDMKSIPVKFIDSANATVRHLRGQKDSVESVLPASSLQFPSLSQSVVVHVNYRQARRLLLDRSAPKGTDSGWWLSDLSDASGSKDVSHFTKISLYQLALDRPDLIKFFAFPNGVQVVVDRRVGVLKDGLELPIKRGSFLDLLNQREAER